MPKWTVPPKGGHMDKRTGVYLQNVIGHEVDERLKMNDILVVPLGANRPSQLYGQAGARPIEVKAYIEGVVGRSSVARAEKAYEGVEQLLDSLGHLVSDVHRTFPPGKLPSIEMMTERDRRRQATA